MYECFSLTNIYTIPGGNSSNLSKTQVSYESGELVELFSEPGLGEPILFIEHDPTNAVMFRIISKIKVVPNNTIVLLLEDYTPESSTGIIKILLKEQRFLCMISQVRKLSFSSNADDEWK